jgi:hypothetical protein
VPAAIVPTAGEFIKMTPWMLFAAMPVNADHAALEDTEHAFDGIGHDIVAASVGRHHSRPSRVRLSG